MLQTEPSVLLEIAQAMLNCDPGDAASLTLNRFPWGLHHADAAEELRKAWQAVCCHSCLGPTQTVQIDGD